MKIIMNARILYLIDLDKTLINGNYLPTMDLKKFTDKVDYLKDTEGIVFSLMSDSAYETLKYWKKVFHFNGPIIAENGANIFWDDKDRSDCHAELIDWHVITGMLVKALNEVIPNVPVIRQDYLKFFREEQELPTESCVVINPFRRYSLALHALRKGKKGVEFDLELWDRIQHTIELVLKGSPLTDFINVDANRSYGIFILADKQVNKSKALPDLKDSFDGYRIIAIGDGETDLVLAGNGIELCAVGNAVPNMKDQSIYVAEKDLTEGVYEIINKDWRKK